MAVFNDVIRDGMKGSVFDQKDTGYANGTANKGTAQKVAFGIKGGVRDGTVNWGVENAMVINYVSCHDNNTLWDKLQVTNPDASQEELLQMNRFCAEIVMLSRGTPFFLAGEEMLRTKGGDHNSYMSPDSVNNLDWEALTPDSDAYKMADFYRQLIAMRQANPFFTQAEVSAEVQEDLSIVVTWTMDGEIVAYAVINPLETERPAELPEGDWTLLLGESLETVPARSVLIVGK